MKPAVTFTTGNSTCSGLAAFQYDACSTGQNTGADYPRHRKTDACLGFGPLPGLERNLDPPWRVQAGPRCALLQRSSWRILILESVIVLSSRFLTLDRYGFLSQIHRPFLDRSNHRSSRTMLGINYKMSNNLSVHGGAIRHRLQNTDPSAGRNRTGTIPLAFPWSWVF